VDKKISPGYGIEPEVYLRGAFFESMAIDDGESNE